MLSANLRFLIVKTSALGDIVQAFNTLDYIHSRWPGATVDWAVESSLASLVSAHPLVSEVIPLNLKGLKKFPGSWGRILSDFVQLRKKRYDVLFDLQGNCKSALITWAAKAKDKVGFGWCSVRERPNLLATNIKFDIPREINIRLHYLKLVQKYAKDLNPPAIEGVRFKMSEEEALQVRSILLRPHLSQPMRIMVCPGSKWVNKQLPLDTLSSLMKKLEQKFDASFLLMWGSSEEKIYCDQIAAQFPARSLVIEKLSLPAWQNLMSEMQLVLAVDSSALHLAGTTNVPSFSLFGPTSPAIFKPIGDRHFALQGPCPYGRTFSKACPILRTCPTGACLRNLAAEEIYNNLIAWWATL